MKRILVLGAGRVAKPLVDYLARLEDVSITVVDVVVSRAEAMTAEYDSAAGLVTNVEDDSVLSDLVQHHDVVVSLLPAPEHPRVAKVCLDHRRHLMTASYISPAMKELAGEAADAGLTFLNECGLDPGLDHMSALRRIHGIQQSGGEVVAFRSYCGGLPAPEANTNPIGYKFSWEPRGALVAATSEARYLDENATVDVPGNRLFAEPEVLTFPGLGEFEAYPNRDALPYIEMYGLHKARTMFRGTLRNLGHCATWFHWVNLGLFDETPRTDLEGVTYRDFMRRFVPDADDVKQGLVDLWNTSPESPAVTNLEWLGMFEDSPVPVTKGGNVDVMAHRMAERCRYEKGERDMILMLHDLSVRVDGRCEEQQSSLVAYGTPGGATAMARTVSLPLAIATHLVLDGAIGRRGVLAPVFPEIYEPILRELEGLGIEFDERAEETG